MYEFYKLTCPQLNGQYHQIINEEGSYNDFKNWLVNNYPNFDADDYNASQQRQSYCNSASMATIWKDTGPDTLGYNVIIFRCRLQDVNDANDARFVHYLDFFLNHPGWTIPGSRETLKFTDEQDIPAEWKDSPYYGIEDF